MQKKSKILMTALVLCFVVATQVMAQSNSDSNQPDVGVNDYLDKVLGTGFFMWPKSAIPIKVFIESGKSVNDYQDSYKDALLSCFDQWAKDSNNRISWQFVPQEDGADIVCAWTDDPKQFYKQNDTHTQAWTNYHSIKGNNGVHLMNHAVINVCTRNARSGEQVSLPFLKASCLHEIGHALGILTHSPVRTDIMFASESQVAPNLQLSARDIATINGLYAACDAQEAAVPTILVTP